MRKLHLTILLILLWRFTLSQGTGFITLNGRQFYDKTGSAFFPMVMNYHVSIVHDSFSTLQYKVVRALDYGTDKCALEGGYSFADCENSLIDDFARMKQMGFNSVRITGDLTPYTYRGSGGSYGFKKWSGIYNFGNSAGQFYASGSRDYFDMYPPYTSTDCQNYFSLIGHFLDIADQQDMKVIYLVSDPSACWWNMALNCKQCFSDRGSSDPEATDYASYLAELAKVLKDKPALLAYDLYNEPIWEVGVLGRNMDKDKGTVCRYVNQWFDAIKDEDPNHLITLGASDIMDVSGWDMGVTKIDFVSMHIYPGPDEYGVIPANSPIRREEIINQFHWFTEELGKPWIIGETGFSASNVACLSNVLWGNEADQSDYMSAVLPSVRDCDGSGFSWWLFQDINWYAFSDNSCFPTHIGCPVCQSTDPTDHDAFVQDYFGLQKYGDPDPSTGLYSPSILKAAAQVSIDFDEGNGVPTVAPCDAPTAFYYDPSHFGSLNLNTSTYLTGRIEDVDGNAISNAVIFALNWLETYIDPLNPTQVVDKHIWIHTYSNDNTTGNNFTIIPYRPLDPNDGRIVYIKVSAVGASKVEFGPWGSVAMNPNVGNIVLTKMNFDYDSDIENITISTSSLKKNYYAWNSLNVTNTTINSGVTNEFVARNEITLNPSFDAEYGSDVHIYLAKTFPECGDYSGLRILDPESENSHFHEMKNQQQIKLLFQKPISKFDIQPNPSSGKYKIIIDSASDIKTMNLIVRNTLGQEILKIEFSGHEYEIDLSNKVNGIYFCELFNDEQKFNEKLIKN